MSQEDRTRWEARYRATPDHGGEHSADPFVEASVSLVEPGCRVLDLACGSGRHALELARRGFEVEAWDVSATVLRALDERARAEGLEVVTREADADLLPAAAPFDWIVCVNYLDRTLAERARPLLNSRACFTLRTFTTERPGERPSERFCLRPGELASGLRGYESLLYEESRGRAGLTARVLRVSS